MFINFSNHPSEGWSKKQKDAAKKYGKILDIPFPKVDAACEESDIESAAKEYSEQILSYISDKGRDAVMVQGEFTLSFAVIERLLIENVTVLSACAYRNVNEYTDENRKTIKNVTFDFVRFREYKTSFILSDRAFPFTPSEKPFKENRRK